MSDEDIRQEYEIIKRSKRDPRAFSVLYEHYFDRIFTFIYRQTDDEALTADLCSQTFIQVLKSLDRYEFRGVPFSAWLYRIARNEVNKYFRKRNAIKIFSIEESRVRELMSMADAEYDDSVMEQLLAYMKDLPTDMLDILQLRFFEDKDFKEIAFILGITESGAKMRVYRALDRLRKKFNLSLKYDVKE
jgi:RNA polymerase sigma-70 factor (ECF subfamily)